MRTGHLGTCRNVLHPAEVASDRVVDPGLVHVGCGDMMFGVMTDEDARIRIDRVTAARGVTPFAAHDFLDANASRSIGGEQYAFPLVPGLLIADEYRGVIFPADRPRRFVGRERRPYLVAGVNSAGHLSHPFGCRDTWRRGIAANGTAAPTSASGRCRLDRASSASHFFPSQAGEKGTGLSEPRVQNLIEVIYLRVTEPICWPMRVHQTSQHGFEREGLAAPFVALVASHRNRTFPQRRQ